MMNTTFTYAGNGEEGGTSERIANSMHRTVDRVASKAGGVEHDLRERIGSLREQARDQQQRARAALSTHVDTALGLARDRKSVIALGAALVAAAVVYSFLRRR